MRVDLQTSLKSALKGENGQRASDIWKADETRLDASQGCLTK